MAVSMVPDLKPNDPVSAVRTGLAARHIPMLDGLRAISVILVVLYHCGTGAPAGLGVLAFFVLSGFLITWLLLKEYDSRGTVSLKSFYARRSLRIFPAFYCYWLIVVTASFLHNRGIPVGQAVASFFYVSNYYQIFAGDPNTTLSHAWSLGIEEQFYILWPVCFLLLARNLQRLIRVLALGLVVVWIYRAVLLTIGIDQGYFYWAFDTRADHLMAGCLLAAVLKSELAPRVVRGVCYSRAAPFASVALLTASSVAASLYGSTYRDSIGFTIDPLIVSVLILQLIAFREHAPWRWLDSRVMIYLGGVSYSIYLYQQLAVGPFLQRLTGLPYGVQLILTLAVCIALAAISYHVVEQPFRRLQRRVTLPASRVQPHVVEIVPQPANQLDLG